MITKEQMVEDKILPYRLACNVYCKPDISYLDNKFYDMAADKEINDQLYLANYRKAIDEKLTYLAHKYHPHKSMIALSQVPSQYLEDLKNNYGKYYYWKIRHEIFDTNLHFINLILYFEIIFNILFFQQEFLRRALMEIAVVLLILLNFRFWANLGYSLSDRIKRNQIFLNSQVKLIQRKTTLEMICQIPATLQSKKIIFHLWFNRIQQVKVLTY